MTTKNTTAEAAGRRQPLSAGEAAALRAKRKNPHYSSNPNDWQVVRIDAQSSPDSAYVAPYMATTTPAAIKKLIDTARAARS